MCCSNSFCNIIDLCFISEAIKSDLHSNPPPDVWLVFDLEDKSFLRFVCLRGGVQNRNVEIKVLPVLKIIKRAYLSSSVSYV